MKRILVALVFVLSPLVHAEEGGKSAQYLWNHETTITTEAKAQLGIGSLDPAGLTGDRGVAITTFLGVDYAVTPDFGMNIGLPLAGTISGGPDNFGLGNIVLGGKYVLPMDRTSVALGLDFELPTAQNRSALGLATRSVALYIDNVMGISPYLAVSHVRDRVTLTAGLGTDLLIYTTVPAGSDRVEDLLNYDAAAALNVFENLWASLEFGGHTLISDSGRQTELFGGAGFRYQDHEVGTGIHLYAPFKRPASSTLDVMAVVDFRVFF